MIPKKLLNSPYRKNLWENANKFIKKIEKILPISSIHLLGSFATNKKRPADVDFIVLLKTKEKNDAKWSLDLVISPDNNHGNLVLKDTKKWMRQKYGAKKSAFIKIK